MADVRLDQRAIDALFTDEDGPVGRYIRQLAEEGAEMARAKAPRDTGRLAGSVRTFTAHEGDGRVYGGFGATAKADAPLSRPGWESGMPYALDVDNRQGFTRNRNRRGRTPTTRRLHRFLTAALEALESRAG
jgi:hypothetical protein